MLMPRFWQNIDLLVLPSKYASTIGNISLTPRCLDFFFVDPIYFLTAKLLLPMYGRKMLFAVWIHEFNCGDPGVFPAFTKYSFAFSFDPSFNEILPNIKFA